MGEVICRCGLVVGRQRAVASRSARSRSSVQVTVDAREDACVLGQKARRDDPRGWERKGHKANPNPKGKACADPALTIGSPNSNGKGYPGSPRGGCKKRPQETAALRPILVLHKCFCFWVYFLCTQITNHVINPPFGRRPLPAPSFSSAAASQQQQHHHHHPLLCSPPHPHHHHPPDRYALSSSKLATRAPSTTKTRGAPPAPRRRRAGSGPGRAGSSRRGRGGRARRRARRCLRAW